MKKIAFIILSLTWLNCAGQTPSMGRDTVKQLSRNSISMAGGANITYPVVSSFLAAIKPSVSAGPWGTLSYYAILHYSNNYSFGIKFGAGAVQYKYTAIINEGDGNSTWTLQQINEIDISAGVFINANISKTIGWYNEIGILGEGVVYYLYNPNAGAINGYQPPQNFTNENRYNIYLYYNTGINININKNITLTPLVAFPLLNITTLFQKNTSTNVNAYNNLRTGLMLTYNFK
jgi:hypothetical protein